MYKVIINNAEGRSKTNIFQIENSDATWQVELTLFDMFVF